MPSSRGFDRSGMVSAMPQNLPGGSTAMVQGLYRGRDEVRSVPGGSQSSLRVIVLFTDGASNSVPGFYDAAPGVTRGSGPTISRRTRPAPTVRPETNRRRCRRCRWLPLQATINQHRSAGIRTTFSLQSPNVYVNGVRQDQRRGLRQQNVATGRYPAQVFNINNAARNLIEIIGQEAEGAQDVGSAFAQLQNQVIRRSK